MLKSSGIFETVKHWVMMLWLAETPIEEEESLGEIPLLLRSIPEESTSNNWTPYSPSKLSVDDTEPESSISSTLPFAAATSSPRFSSAQSLAFVKAEASYRKVFVLSVMSQPLS